MLYASLSLLCGSEAVAGEAKRRLLVTVDDLPLTSAALHPNDADRLAITEGLLAAMARHHIKAVGLVAWKHVRNAADRALLERWLAAGHELGNHSATHPSYTETSSAAYIADVERGRREVATLLEAHGKTLRFFRFPFLNEGDTPDKLAAMRAYLASSGQRNLPPTIDDQDWAFEEPWVREKGQRALIGADYQAALRIAVKHHEAVGDKLFGRQVPSILLLHATEVSAAQWPVLFDWLEATGHVYADADTVLADPAFAAKHDVAAPFGYGLWDRLRQERREKAAVEAVAATLAKQVEAWNRGDVTGFTAVYATDAVFISPSGLTRGRQAVLDRYRAKYPDRAAMGTLTLEPIESRPTNGVEFNMQGDALPSRVHGVSVVARWTLRYPSKPAATGLTLLVLRPRGDTWQIVQDASM